MLASGPQPGGWGPEASTNSKKVCQWELKENSRHIKKLERFNTLDSILCYVVQDIFCDIRGKKNITEYLEKLYCILEMDLGVPETETRVSGLVAL